MTNLRKHVEDAICARILLRRGERVLVAVSGGVDSMVLLRVLHDLASKYQWVLEVAHFNHQLRGRSSTADARMVERTAKALGLRFEVGRGNVKSFACKRGVSVEMAARELRHRFLARVAKRRSISTIALAHHADDQVELFFLRLLRGGGDGLAGMKWTGVSPVNSAVRLIRPLLNMGKMELRLFAKENGITFREDASNASLDIQRNRIRRELLPLLRKRYQPALDKAILRVMEIVRAESEFASESARAWLNQKRRKAFADLPLAVQRGALRAQLWDRGIAPEFDLIEQLRLQPDKPVCITARETIRRDGSGKIHVATRSSTITTRPRVRRETAQVDVRSKEGTVVFAGTAIGFEITNEWGATMKRKPDACEFFDADKVGGRLILRHWQAGDRFQPIGMNGAVKLQDLFTNGKIPRAARHHLTVATTARGEIFWVEGLRIGERFKLDKDTRYRLKWTWQHL